MRRVANLFIVSCALAWARSAVADDTICIINMSEYPIDFRVSSLTGDFEQPPQTISLAAKAGDQNQCIHVSELVHSVRMHLAVNEGERVVRYGRGSDMSPMEGPYRGDSGFAKAENWGTLCYTPSLVGDGTWYKNCHEDNISIGGLASEGYLWPADYLLCNGNTCVYHSGNAGDGLYRIWVLDRKWF